MKYLKSALLFTATLSLAGRAASSETEVGALELVLNTTRSVINFNVSEDQNVLGGGDVFAERYTLDQVFLFERLVENYCANLKMNSSSQGLLENRIVEFIGDNQLYSPHLHNYDDIRIVQQRSKIAVAMLSVMRTSCDSLNQAPEQVDSLTEWDDNELRVIQELNKELAVELLENGFVSVDEGELTDWESLLAQHQSFLVNQKTVSQKLRFEPTSLIKQDGLEYIGSEAIGMIAKEGSDSVVSLYMADFGPVSITEIDLSDYEVLDANNAAPSYFKTTKVGGSDVLVYVMRGQTTGKYESKLLWRDELLNRDYAISVNINVNDSTSSDHLEKLFALVKKTNN